MFNKLLFTMACFLAAVGVHAQEISGNVSDTDGLPLPGVSVVAVGSGTGATTDLDGNFTLNVPAGTDLQFSMVGFKQQQAAAAAGMRIVLESDVTSLEEVRVIGYGTRKAGAITGSTVQIKATDIVKTPAQSAIQAIQGKAAGVNIVTNDEPGGTPTIRIRGLGTILSGRDPLYIIDGVESYGMNGLSPNEIATIDILKDASSLAIYGQKGSNGVIIITTKKGKAGKIQINYDAYYGQKFVQKKVKMADNERFTYFANSAMGSASYFNPNQPYSTDWFDEITTTGEVMNNYLSMSGGSDNANYYLGLTNYKEKGILEGTTFERQNISNRNEFRALDDKLKFNSNINIVISRNTPKPVSAFTNAYKQAPIVPVRFENGRWGQPIRNTTTGLVDINGSDRFNNVANPVAQLYNFDLQQRNVLLSGSFGMEAKLAEFLKFTSNFGATYNTYKSEGYTSDLDAYLTTNPTLGLEDFEDTFQEQPAVYNRFSQTRGTTYEWNWDNYVTFDKDFGKHGVTAVVGMSRTTKGEGDVTNGTRYNLPVQRKYWSFDFSDFNFGRFQNPDDVLTGINYTPTVSIAYFARGEYSYDDKYLLTLVMRREGVSRFQKGKQWDNFPAISAGWVISDEDFLRNNKIITYLKLRGGYGEVGNSNTPSATNNRVFSPNYNYAFGPSQDIYSGSSIPYEVDPNLTWEKMTEIDLGLDFKVGSRLSGTIDAYSRKSNRLIVPIALPDVLSPGRVTVNAGEVINKGLELSLRWDDSIGNDWKYWVSGNYSYNKNELTEVANDFFADYIGGDLGNGQYTKQVLVGQPLGSFYVYQTTGFNNFGQFTYSANRVVAGSYIPTSTFGFSFGVNWRNWELSADAYGVAGNKIYNGKKAQRFGNENIEYDYLNSFWTPSTPNATNPRPDNSVPIASSYYIEDGSYLRINNITIGYTLPELTDKINKVRIYATAVNPFVFTKYSGFSPEVSGGSSGDPLGRAGIELDAYPTNKTFLVGVNVSF